MNVNCVNYFVNKKKCHYLFYHIYYEMGIVSNFLVSLSILFGAIVGPGAG